MEFLFKLAYIIGVNGITIVNQAAGIIEANQSVALTLDPNSGGLNNTGIMRAVNSGILEFRPGNFDNHGQILVNGTSPSVGKITIGSATVTNFCLGNISIIEGTFDNDGTLITHGDFTKFGGIFDNSGTIQHSMPIPTPNPNTGTITPIATICISDLSITKIGVPNPVDAGNQLSYTIMANNTGPHNAKNVVITDILPNGVTLVSTTGCAEDPTAIPSCSLGNILLGNSSQYNITVTVDLSTSGIITNQANVTADTIDPNNTNDVVNTQTTVIPECAVPISGDWTIQSSCNISSNIIAPASVIIQNNSVVIIKSGGSLTILFGENIIVVNNSGLKLEQGSNLQVNS
ncbi:MAG: DUF11 domain-containing protein [Nitrosopumilaceae archaeon]